MVTSQHFFCVSKSTNQNPISYLCPEHFAVDLEKYKGTEDTILASKIILYNWKTWYIHLGIKRGFTEEELLELNLEEKGRGFGGTCIADRGNGISHGPDYRKQKQHIKEDNKKQ